MLRFFLNLRLCSNSLRHSVFILIPLCLILNFTADDRLTAQQIVSLKNGVELRGGMTAREEYKQDGSAKPGTSIVIVDNGFRRVFTNRINMRKVEDYRPIVEEFELEHLGISGEAEIGSLGPIIRKTPFNQYGRRMTEIVAPDGSTAIVNQGIQRITPSYAVLRTVKTNKAAYKNLEMRVATSSIPRNTLSRILRHSINPSSESDRLKIVAFYQQAERYRDAETELKELIKDFPELAEEKDREIRLLRQAWANQLVREIRNRVNVGQPEFAKSMIERFPTKEVADDILFDVRDIRDQLDKVDSRRKLILQRIDSAFVRYGVGKDFDPARSALIDKFKAELESELVQYNFGRLAPFMTFADDPSISGDQSVSLAVSGWTLGGDNAIENVEVAFSIYEARDYIRDYLAAKNLADRNESLEKLKKTEGYAVKNISDIIKNLGPYIESTEENETKGLYRIELEWNRNEPPMVYWVQLPPNYNQHKEYPCVLTLSGSGTSANQQIDWWSGNYSQEQKIRRGEGARRGYIVIAPEWKVERQTEYKYSLREHAKILSCFRDALRRFSIDSDNVFLTGHSMGGTAAWDIGFSHPDLWAGVIPIVAKSDKYMEHYYENARNTLPVYFVHGEKDYDSSQINARHWNRYLPYPGYDIMLIEYRGRSHEHFYEEIKELFNWMDLHQRDLRPEKFLCKSARPWDNFFWFIEIDEVRPNSIVLPEEYGFKKEKNLVRYSSFTSVEGSIKADNDIIAKSTAVSASILFSPDFIDFDRPILLNGKEITVEPDPLFLLEDVRRRADRKHQFWQKAPLK